MNEKAPYAQLSGFSPSLNGHTNMASDSDNNAVPRPLSSRTIRPARPVSGAAQSNVMLGTPLNASSSPPSTSLTLMHAPDPASNSGYASGMYLDESARGVRSSATVNPHGIPDSATDDAQASMGATNNALTRIQPDRWSHLYPPPLGASGSNAQVPARMGPQPLMPESLSRQENDTPESSYFLAPSVSAPQPEPSAPETPASPSKAQDLNRPRGFKKFLAMMTCSSATVSTALDGHQGSAPNKASMPPSQTRASLPPARDPSASLPSQQEELNELNANAAITNSNVNSTGTANVGARTSMRPNSTATDFTEPMTEINNTHGLLRVPSSANRHSIAASTTSSHSTVEEDATQGVITQVSPNAPMISMGMSDPEMEQEIFAEEQRLIQQGGTGIPLDEYGRPCPLLAQVAGQDITRKCLVLDLDETLVHSSFKMVPNADFVVPVEIEGVMHNVYVIKRPGVDEFLRLMGQIYEVVIFTASLNKYADPVIDILDIHRVVRHRLFRESCYNHYGSYVKDLSQLGRPLHNTIILDNSPASYVFHPTNAVPVSSWFNDPHDTELTDLCPFLEDLCYVEDVRIVLDGYIDVA